MTGNRIELEGRLLGKPEIRVTPAGTPVLRFTVDCGAPGEELRLGIVMTGESATGQQNGSWSEGGQVRGRSAE